MRWLEGLFQYADCSISTTGYAGASDDKNNPYGYCLYRLWFKNGNIIKTIRYVSKFKTRIEIKKDFCKTAIKNF